MEFIICIGRSFLNFYGAVRLFRHKNIEKHLVIDSPVQARGTLSYDHIEEQNLSITKTLKTRSSKECNLQSTFLPATECVKENEEQDNTNNKSKNQ